MCVSTYFEARDSRGLSCSNGDYDSGDICGLYDDVDFTEENTRLVHLKGFENIHTITGHLTLVGNARLFTIESFRSLEHVEKITITRNPALDSVAGLRNLRSVDDIYIRGDSIVSMEYVGRSNKS